PAAFATVEIDLGADGTVDGTVTANEYGVFNYYPLGLAAGAVTRRARVSQRVQYLETEQAGNWSSHAASPLEDMAHTNSTVAELALANDTGEADDDGETDDPTLRGRISGPNNLAFVTVQFDHNQDGTVDGTTQTDAVGEFRYYPHGLS